MHKSTYRKCIDSLLRDADRITALTPGTPGININNELQYPAVRACVGSLLELQKEWKRLRNRMASAAPLDVATRATGAKAWLDAHREVRAFERVGPLLRSVLERAAVATSATDDVEARYAPR